MPVPDPAHTEDLALLELAARKAGEIALGYFGKGPRTWMKEGASPVSEADMAVDAWLKDTLGKARSEYGWLSEETADTPARLGRRRLFIVDPIDGTRAFLAGKDEWTVSLAMVEEGRPRAAALYNPVRGEMFLAVEGGGTRLNGRLIQTGERQMLDGARAYGPPAMLAAAAAAGVIAAGTIGSLAYRIALVAKADVDVAVARARAHDWDLAAADLLVQEAGGRLTDLSGTTLRYNREILRHPELVAAGDALIEPAVRLFAGLADRQGRERADH